MVQGNTDEPTVPSTLAAQGGFGSGVCRSPIRSYAHRERLPETILRITHQPQSVDPMAITGIW